MSNEREYLARCAELRLRLRALGRVAVAFSGGVDSAVLLHAAHAELGAGAVGLIADSPSLPRSELVDALAFARRHGLPLEVLATDELSREAYRANTGERCYWCKSALFEAMGAWAGEHGVETLAFGEITDDALDERPGARAAGELGVIAPLSAAGLGKRDVRRYAREHGLEVADKPAAACLASRLPVGTRVSAERLARVERSEAALRALGLRQLRVRDHGRRARVEVGAGELEHARSCAAELTVRLAAEGFDEHELAVYRSPT